MSLGEFQLISRYFSQAQTDEQLQLAVGDDAAVIGNLGNSRLVVSTDTLVESVHFPKNAAPELLARRALRVNLSDMAAMGAQPKWITLTLTLPGVDEAWLSAFSRGLHTDLDKYGCKLVGGDTSKGPLNIGIQIMGVIDEAQRPITRSGAKPDDLLVVTGTLGDAGAALKFDLNANLNSSFNSDLQGAESYCYFLQRYWLPSPRVEFALNASSFINAACDISDGLQGDVGHLCTQSRLSAIIELDSLPLSDSLSSALSNCDRNAKMSALTAGDDYELCMAVSENHYTDMKATAEKLNLAVTRVGRFVESKNQVHRVKVVDQKGQEIEPAQNSYAHF